MFVNRNELINFLPDPMDEKESEKILERSFLEITSYEIKKLNFDYLTNIHLWGWVLTLDSTKSLCDILCHNNTVTFLGIESNLLGDDAIGYISNMLDKNSSLKSLGIGGNNFTNTGMKMISESLRHNSTLTQIIAVNNDFTLLGYLDMIKCLKDNHSLQKMMLGPIFSGISNFDDNSYSIEQLLKEVLNCNESIMYLDTFEYLNDSKIKEDLIHSISFNIYKNKYFDNIFPISIEQLLINILLPLRKYHLLRILPNDLLIKILNYLGVQFKNEIRLWKDNIKENLSLV